MTNPAKNTAVKRILSLDGGGIRGTMSAQILVEIETALQNYYGNSQYCLGDFFDLVGGTSTGSILAAGIANGIPAQKLLHFYENEGPKIFTKNWYANIPGLGNFTEKVWTQYNPSHLEQQLQRADVFNNTTLGDPSLKCFLTVVAKNATTGSTCLFTSDPKNPDYSKTSQVKLSDIVRASSAAPTFFPPHRFAVDGQQYEFIDGGVSLYNNPSFQLFLQARQQMKWNASPDQLLLVSIGTGFAYEDIELGEAKKYTSLDWARYLISQLMDEANVGQNQILKLISYEPNQYDYTSRSVSKGQTFALALPEQTTGKLLTYYRFNASFDQPRLQALGLQPSPQQIEALKKMDCVEQIDFLEQIGLAVAQEQFEIHRFDGFLGSPDIMG